MGSSWGRLECLISLSSSMLQDHGRSTLGLVTLELLNPDRLPASPAYTHVVVARGARTIYISGQVAAGARPSDVAKLTTYVVDYRPDLLPAIADARAALFGDHRPASTLVGVAAL